jgi:zinc/manganese transport system substrate-binding protein
VTTGWRGGVGSAIAACIVASGLAHAEPIKVVAAESVYGDVVAQIGGPRVAVKSILTNPNQDPHAFEASASTARAIAEAKLVIYNGADYDPWAERLVAASASSTRENIEVARLVDKKAGDNPHLWYQPAAVSALAAAVADRLTRLDPEHTADYARALSLFEAAMGQLAERIGALRVRHAGSAVTATEPVFEYMADALGLQMRNRPFQLAVMNGTEPSAAAIAAFENDLRTHAVKVLLYNSQTTAALARRMRNIADAAGVPVIAITETEPAGVRYQEWMLLQLDALDRALSGR